MFWATSQIILKDARACTVRVACPDQRTHNVLTQSFCEPQYRVLIIICTCSVTAVSTVFNIFGMNIGLSAIWRNSHRVFLEIVLSSIIFAIGITVLLVWYCRRKRILCY